MLSVKVDQVASFLGKKITQLLAQELGSQFATRIEGTCIKHRFGKAGVKIYDKFGRVLRLETNTNDVSLFKHHCKAEHRDGQSILAQLFRLNSRRLHDLGVFFDVRDN